MVDRGWMRRATQSFPANRHIGKYVVQASLWRDKKIVPWLHTVDVGPETTTTCRRSRGQRTAKKIPCPQVQDSYAKNFNGVDLSDKDSAKHSTSLWTNRWYLHLFFWLLDRVVHACYIVTVALVRKQDFDVPGWEIYTSKHNGRKRFQTHLGIALMNKGIELDWKDPSNENDKPKWMPQTAKNGKYHPCDCKICFFCLHGKTSSITHGNPQTLYCV